MSGDIIVSTGYLKHGLRHVDLYYEDGSNPPESVLQVTSTYNDITAHEYEYEYESIKY